MQEGTIARWCKKDKARKAIFWRKKKSVEVCVENRLVVCEEGWGVCGLGAEIAAQAMESAFDWLDAPVQRVHAVDVPLPRQSETLASCATFETYDALANEKKRAMSLKAATSCAKSKPTKQQWKSAVEEGTLAKRLFADGTQGVAVCRQSGNPGAAPGGRYRACRPHGVQLDVVRW